MHPRGALEAYLRRDPALHVYELGDLDPRQARHVTWYARGSPIDAVALVYRALRVPTLLALAHGPIEPVRELLSSIRLPPRLHAHVTPGVERALVRHGTAGASCQARAPFQIEPLGRYLKMRLAATPRDHAEVETLGPGDVRALTELYAAHYPGGYFHAASLEAGPYVGLRDAHGLACVAGVHLLSPVMRVAALGNVVTRTDVRGRGLAGRVTEALCARLARRVDLIGLNVAAANTAALRCYRRIGFEPRAEYDELLVTRAEPAASGPR